MQPSGSPTPVPPQPSARQLHFDLPLPSYRPLEEPRARQFTVSGSLALHTAAAPVPKEESMKGEMVTGEKATPCMWYP